MQRRCEVSELLPFLEVRGPEGQEFSVELTQDRVTVGRFPQFNDIALEPDPQQLVTRKGHCAIERDPDSWWVIDNASVNKTFVQRGQAVEMVNGRAPVADGDVIRILGRLTETGDAIYWELAFRDPMKTQPADGLPRVAYLEYDWIQAKLFRVEGTFRQEIRGLRPQEHKLIRYMDQRNRANDNVPVMCSYEELITAIWGDEAYGHTEAEVNRLIWELRQKLELDPKEPHFLETVRGLGYRLRTRPVSD
jgi:hypothetical protein